MSRKKPVGYLLAGKDRPKPLRPGDEWVFGRDPSNNYFSDDAHASRKHAQVTVKKDGSVELQDLGSMNGTWLNEERMDANTPTTLQSGDMFRVGGRMISYVGADGGKEFGAQGPVGPDYAAMATIQMTLGSKPSNAPPGSSTSRREPVGNKTSEGHQPPATDSSLSGNLKDQGLPQIVQFLHSTANTGELNVKSGALSGVIGFQDGHAVFAQGGDYEGEEAFYACAKLKEGTFHFKKAGPILDRPRNLDTPTMMLVFEACRLMDEGSRAEE